MTLKNWLQWSATTTDDISTLEEEIAHAFGLSTHAFAMSQVKLREVFDSFDADKNGIVDMDELQGALQALLGGGVRGARGGDVLVMQDESHGRTFPAVAAAARASVAVSMVACCGGSGTNGAGRQHLSAYGGIRSRR